MFDCECVCVLTYPRDQGRNVFFKQLGARLADEGSGRVNDPRVNLTSYQLGQSDWYHIAKQEILRVDFQCLRELQTERTEKTERY